MLERKHTQRCPSGSGHYQAHRVAKHQAVRQNGRRIKLLPNVPRICRQQPSSLNKDIRRQSVLSRRDARRTKTTCRLVERDVASRRDACLCIGDHVGCNKICVGRVPCVLRERQEGRVAVCLIRIVEGERPLSASLLSLVIAPKEPKSNTHMPFEFVRFAPAVPLPKMSFLPIHVCTLFVTALFHVWFPLRRSCRASVV